MKGSIVKRGATYSVILELRDPLTGKRKRKWHSFKGNKREAEAECARLVSAHSTGTYLEPRKQTVSEYLEAWLKRIAIEVSPKTHERYAEIVRNNLIPSLGSIVLQQLKPGHISDAYSGALKTGRRDGSGGLSARTVQHMHRVLQRALGPVRWHRMHSTSEDMVKPPKVEKKSTMQTYDAAQTVAALALAKPTRMHIPAVLALLCGVRRGEISALRWRNVDLEKGQLAVRESVEQLNGSVRLKPTKTGRDRTVALSADVVAELKAHRICMAEGLLKLGVRLTNDHYVCALEDGSMLRPTLLTHEWVKLIKGSTLPRVRFHDLRHTHATLLLMAGVHPKIASERLGHSKVGITLDLYSHVMPGMQEDAAARVDAALRAVQDTK